MVDALPTLQAFEQMGKIIGQLGRHQEGEWLANDFFQAVPIELFRAPVPAGDDPFQTMANDRVIRGVDNGRQALPDFFTPFAFRDVTGEAACMDELALLPQYVGVD